MLARYSEGNLSEGSNEVSQYLSHLGNRNQSLWWGKFSAPKRPNPFLCSGSAVHPPGINASHTCAYFWNQSKFFPDLPDITVWHIFPTRPLCSATGHAHRLLKKTPSLLSCGEYHKKILSSFSHCHMSPRFASKFLQLKLHLSKSREVRGCCVPGVFFRIALPPHPVWEMSLEDLQPYPHQSIILTCTHEKQWNWMAQQKKEKREILFANMCYIFVPSANHFHTYRIIDKHVLKVLIEVSLKFGWQY